jgi:hypothetical protein
VAPSAIGAGYSDAATGYAGLAFAAVDASYTSSSLLFNNPTTGDLRELSAGESGDPFVTVAGGRLWLFNRSPASLNFRSFTPTAQTFERTCQVATPLAASGDPAAALLLDAHRLLLAHNVAGLLAVIDPDTGALVQQLDGPWALGVAGAPFRPAAFTTHKAADGTTEVFVVHQGLDAKYNPNGTQRLFVLHDDGTTLAPVDIGPASAAGVQGLPLPITNPGGFLPGDGPDEAILYGQCTVQTPGACTQGFARIDLAQRTATLAFDVSSLGVKDNGGLIKGPGTSYYALMNRTATKANVVTEIDLAAKTGTDVYTFTSPSGCCALYYDDTDSALYIGDADATEQNGFFSVLKPGQATAKVPLPALAYSGVFLPR